MPRKQVVIGASVLDAQMSGSEAWAGIVPYNPSAFPPSVEVKPKAMTAGVPFSLVTFSSGKQGKVLYRDVLMLRSHGCEGAARSPDKAETDV